MPKPRTPRFINFNPSVYFFKPQGVPLRMLEEVILESDEYEAMRLHDILEFDQKTAAKKMKISQPTFARILNSANKKIAEAIVKGKAIRINSANYDK